MAFVLSVITNRRVEFLIAETYDLFSFVTELLLTKLIEDEDSDGEGIGLFRPIEHALSPLPPSPPSFEVSTWMSTRKLNVLHTYFRQS